MVDAVGGVLTCVCGLQVFNWSLLALFNGRFLQQHFCSLWLVPF
jgi:hypothetical protein